MIFFLLSLLASICGGVTAQVHYGFSLQIQLSIDNPFAGIISFWPFIVVLVLLLLGILWYQTLKTVRTNRTKGTNRQRHGVQTTFFLGVVTVMVLILMAAPYYLKNYGDDVFSNDTEVSAENRVEMVLTVYGMDCGGCEALVHRRVEALSGIESVSASHVNEQVMVIYDKSKVSVELIAQAIESAGYTVVLE
jgi:copper chaperone CopZ